MCGSECGTVHVTPLLPEQVHTALAIPPRELDHSIVKPHYVHAVPVLHGEATFSFVEFEDEQGETLHGRVHLLLSVAFACADEDDEDRAVAFVRRWIPQATDEGTGCMVMHPAVFDNGYHVVPIDAIQKTVHMVQSFEHPTRWFLNNNPTTNDCDIHYHVNVSLSQPVKPFSVLIKKGADVALTVARYNTEWTNRTLSESERAELDKQPPPSPPASLGYTYEITGTWLSASTLWADIGRTYMRLVNAMLVAPDAYTALIYPNPFGSGTCADDDNRSLCRAHDALKCSKEIGVIITWNGC
ncbi:unnamed protein product [Closterium sp. Naga37s-1]|nr:unnamed protein product [Closterium sp. Naga37s-1]